MKIEPLTQLDAASIQQMSDLDSLATQEITQEDLAANTAQALETGLDPQEVADAANLVLGEDY